jgi:hypothetical protein
VHFFVARDTGIGVAPDTLPVEPPPPSASVENERSFAATCTGMADLIPGNCGATTQMTFYYTFDGSDPDSNSSFVVGAYGTCSSAGDTTDTFYAVFASDPDDSTVKWIAEGIAKNGIVDWGDAVQSFVQGGAAWVGNGGSTPTDCTIWAEIYVGDGGSTTWVKFDYTTDGSDPKTSGTAHTAVGYYIATTDSSEIFGAYLTAGAGNTIRWYVRARGSDNSYSESAIQTCTAGITSGPTLCNLTEDAGSLVVTAPISPRGYGSEIRLIYTHDGTDPKTSGTAYSIEGSYVSEDDPSGDCTDAVAVFDAQLYALEGETVKWYAHGWYQTHNKYNGLFGDSDVRTFIADSTHTGIPNDEARVLRLTNSPNPFTGATDIVFTLTSSAHLHIRVYDISGRMVADLYDGLAGEGQNVVTWGGRTGTGQELPPGLYFYRFETRNYRATRKAIVIR